MHIHTDEELELIRKLAKIEGIEVLGEVLCYTDPEAGDIDIREYASQSGTPFVFDPEWSFMYPVYARNCLCEDTQLLAELETEWDEEKQEIVTIKGPRKFFGHSFFCLTPVPDYTLYDSACIRVAKLLVKDWNNERKLEYVDTLMSGTHLNMLQFLAGGNDGQES